MAHAILDRLYNEKVLSRSIRLVDPAGNVANSQCGKLSSSECHTSAMCWVDPADLVCKLYGVGSSHSHEIRA